MQPSDSGTFEASKSEYRRKTDNFAFGNMENNFDLICDVDQLAAMKWMKKIR